MFVSFASLNHSTDFDINFYADSLNLFAMIAHIHTEDIREKASSQYLLCHTFP